MDFDKIAVLVNQIAVERKGRPLKDVERLVLKGAWENKTYSAMATTTAGYTEDYLKKDVGPKLWQLLSELVDPDIRGMRVTKRNIQSVLQTWLGHGLLGAETPPSATAPPPEPPTPEPTPLGLAVQDSPRIDLADCGGREAELATLSRWIAGEESGQRCRTVVLWGLPGIGKTTLAAAAAAAVAPQVERCGYLRLLPELSANDGLTAIAHWLDPAVAIATPQGTIDWVIDQMNRRRVLLIVDGMEQLFEPQQLLGSYRTEAEALQGLFRQGAERHHQSCLLWISREKPADFTQVQGPRVQQLYLDDLALDAAQLLLQPAGAALGKPEDWARLIERYGSHPLVLRGLGATLRELYQGRPQPLLQATELTVPGAVSRRFAQALERLCPEEWVLLYRLALAQGAIALDELTKAMSPPPEDRVMQSLLSRGWVQSTPTTDHRLVVSLKPVVQTLVLDRLRELLLAELEAEQLRWWHRLPLVTVTAEEEVQERQRAAVLIPLGRALGQRYGTQVALAAKGDRLLRAVRSLVGQPGYGPGNIIHLCQHLGLAVSGADFTNLTLWQTDLRRVSLQGANFSQAQFRDTTFATALGRNPVAAFCPQGRYLATGDHEGRLLLWDLTYGKLVWMFDQGQHQSQSQSQGVCALAFNPQGDLLAVGTETGSIWLWPVGTTYQIDALEHHRQPVRALAFSPDGSQLASGDDAGQLCLWEVASGFAQGCLEWHEGPIHSLVYNDGGDRLVSAGDDQRACLWQVAEGTVLKPFQARSTATLRTAGWLRDPHDPACPPIPFAAGHDDHCLTIWNLNTGLPCWILPADVEALLAMAVSPDGRHLVCSCQDFTVALWDIPQRRHRYRLPSLGAPVWALAFSADSRYVMTGGDYAIKLWSVKSGQGWRSFLSQAHSVRCLALGTAGGAQGCIVTGHDDAQLRLWEVVAGSPYAVGPRTLAGHDGAVRAVALSADGQWLVSSASDRTLRLWALATGQVQWVAALAVPATLLSLSADGQWLASASTEGQVTLWNVATGAPVGDLENSPEHPSALCFSADSQHLLIGGRDGSIGWWSVGQSCCQGHLQGHQGPVHGLAHSAAGSIIASASHDGTVRWWQFQGAGGPGQGLPVRHPEGSLPPPVPPQGQWRHPAEHWLQGVAISSTDEILAIASDDAHLELWDVCSNQRRHRLQGHSQDIWQVAVSPSRTHLITASHDDEIRVWALESGNCQQTLRPDRPYEGVNIRGATGLSDTEVRMLKSLGAIVSY
jgi:WD40 repeat protein